ncbi:MAG TPA: hypothetical protein VH817_14150 [Thermoleophilaceae bacterium]|jgi:hypothetical protein
MNEKRHAMVGWVVTQLGVWMARRAIKRKKQAISENRAKIGAAGAIALVLIGGVAVAKLAGNGNGNGDD